MDQVDISVIRDTAARAAANAAELEGAIDAERSAEADVLTLALDAARPALRAICSRMQSANVDTGLGTERQRNRTEFHERRGLHLAGADRSERDCPRADCGSYDELTGLYLLDDGALTIRSWSGTWSKWQGASDELITTLAPVTVRDAMDEWELAECLESLRVALDKQATGKAPEKARAARERADRLRAMVALAQ